MKRISTIAKQAFPLFLCLMLALTLWAPARAASGTDYKPILEATLANIRNTVTDPVNDSYGGEWAVLALARGGVEDDAWYGKYLENLFPVVDGCNGALHGEVKYTEYSRTIIGLSSIGQDATKLNTGNKVYDLVSPLTKKQSNGEYWASYQGNNGTIFAIIALDTQNYINTATGRQVRAGLIDALLDAQDSSGGWGHSSPVPDVDTTAMALQALAPYYLSQTKYDALGASHSYTNLKNAVSKALSYLKNVQAVTDGVIDYGSVEASAQVVVALAALNRDAAKDALLGDVLSSVLDYYNGSGGFVHDHTGGTANNQMSTEQAAYSLVAYDRWKNGNSSLYDMTDRGAVSAISFDAPSDATVTQTATGRFTVSCATPCVAVVQNADKSYTALTPEGAGNTRSFHTVHASVTVVILGDANGDGKFDGSDITRAKAAYLGKTALDEVHRLAMDANRDQKFEGSDITRAKAAYLGKTSLDW